MDELAQPVAAPTPDGGVVEGSEVDLGEDHAGRGAALEAVHRVDEDVAVGEDRVAQQVVASGGRLEREVAQPGERREQRMLAAPVGDEGDMRPLEAEPDGAGDYRYFNTLVAFRREDAALRSAQGLGPRGRVYVRFG